jgi:antitoxin (DNA-binding transcriptional repressor) of toxin-antitoxin stability system
MQVLAMKSVTIAEFKRNLPVLLGEVAKGSSIIVQRGRSRENVAILAPYSSAQASARQLGLLSKRGKPVFTNWSMNDEVFLESR